MYGLHVESKTLLTIKEKGDSAKVIVDDDGIPTVGYLDRQQKVVVNDCDLEDFHVLGVRDVYSYTERSQGWQHVKLRGRGAHAALVV